MLYRNSYIHLPKSVKVWICKRYYLDTFTVSWSTDFLGSHTNFIVTTTMTLSRPRALIIPNILSDTQYSQDLTSGVT